MPIGQAAIGFQGQQMRRTGLHAGIPTKADAIVGKPFIRRRKKVSEICGLQRVVHLTIGVDFGHKDRIPPKGA